MKKLTTEEFIERANKRHNFKYDYSKTEYIGSTLKTCIICKTHGEFWQRPHNHLKGQGCPKCSGNYMNTEYFIECSKKVHGNKYDYSLVDYTGKDIKVKIICPTHGIFEQRAGDHLRGHGCPLCYECRRGDCIRKQEDDFIAESTRIHNNKYDYSKVAYVNNHTKVKIGCPIHGYWEQTPHNHLQGHGCPKCIISKGELKIQNFLLENKISFQAQYVINLGLSLFGRDNIKVDFYIEYKNKKYIIEYNGIQHYEYIKHFHQENGFESQKMRDARLGEWCKHNKVKLIEIRYDQFDDIEEILNKQLLTFKNIVI